MKSESESMIFKALSSNDLGLTGSHQAGITVPKTGRVLNFFPVLDPTVFNPRLELDGYDEVLDSPVNLYFIYYNGKIHGTSTRNEYRLTGLTRFFKMHNAAVGDELRLTRLTHGRIGLAIDSKKDTILATERLASPARIKLSGQWSTYRKAHS